MIIDKQLLFSEAQDISQVAGSYLSTNTLDLRAADSPVAGSLIHDIGRGRAPEIIAQIIEAVTSGGAAEVECQLVTADNAALDSNLTVILTSGPIAKAALVAGYQFKLGRVPAGITQKYMGLRYVITTNTTTAGTITAFLSFDRQTNPSVSG